MIALLAAVAFGGVVADGTALFEAGRTEEAVAAWQSSVDAGRPSGVVLTNLGVAAYHAGDLPRAIGWWRGARSLRPRDGDVSHDLATARADLDGAGAPAGEAVRWLELVTPGELGGVGLGWLAACLVALVARRRRRGGYLPATALGVAGGAVIAVALHGLYVASHHPVVVVVDGPAIAREGAWALAEERFVLQAGSEVRWERGLGDFALVRTGDDRRGWVPTASLFAAGRTPADAGSPLAR